MKIGYRFTAPPAVYTTRDISIEGSVFTLMCTKLITKELIGRICDTPEKAEMIGVGGAWAEIIAPDGQTIGGPIKENNEGIVYADIDLEMIAYTKNACDSVGHNTRPDLLQLLFHRETPMPVKEVSLEEITLTSKQLSSVLNKYENLKQRIEKSGDKKLINIALTFEQELKNVT
jgi:nitrilase